MTPRRVRARSRCPGKHRPYRVRPNGPEGPHVPPDEGVSVAEKYDFLSDEWFVAARKIRDELAPSATQPVQELRMNLIITGAPFNDGAEIKTHIDTSGQKISSAVRGPDERIRYQCRRTMLRIRRAEAATPVCG